jgi:hypothetical protein
MRSEKMRSEKEFLAFSHLLRLLRVFSGTFLRNHSINRKKEKHRQS